MKSLWRWRSLRDFGFSVHLWPLHWWPLARVARDDDEWGGAMILSLGPLDFHFTYNSVGPHG